MCQCEKIKIAEALVADYESRIAEIRRDIAGMRGIPMGWDSCKGCVHNGRNCVIQRAYKLSDACYTPIIVGS